jgi:hypothetical protein
MVEEIYDIITIQLKINNKKYKDNVKSVVNDLRANLEVI